MQDNSSKIKANKQGYNIVNSIRGFSSTNTTGSIGFAVCPWMPAWSNYDPRPSFGLNKSLLADCLTHTHYRVKRFRVLLNNSVPSTSTVTVSLAGCKDPTLDQPSWDYMTTMEKSIQFSAWAPNAAERVLDITQLCNRDWLRIDTTVMQNSSSSDKFQCLAGQFFISILTSDTSFDGQFLGEMEFEFKGRNPYDTTTKMLLSTTNTTASTTNVTDYYKPLDGLPMYISYDKTNSKPQIKLQSGYQLFTLMHLAPQTATSALTAAVTIYDNGGNDVTSTRTIIKLTASNVATGGSQYINNSGSSSGTTTATVTDTYSMFYLICARNGDRMDFYVDNDDTLVANRTATVLSLTPLTNKKALEIVTAFTPSQTTLPYY